MLLPLHLRPTNGRYAHDWREFEGPMAARPRVMTICNPHNPTGRVFDRDELLRLCEFAVAQDMVIVSALSTVMISRGRVIAAPRVSWANARSMRFFDSDA